MPSIILEQEKPSGFSNINYWINHKRKPPQVGAGAVSIRLIQNNLETAILNPNIAKVCI